MCPTFVCPQIPACPGRLGQPWVFVLYNADEAQLWHQRWLIGRFRAYSASTCLAACLVWGLLLIDAAGSASDRGGAAEALPREATRPRRPREVPQMAMSLPRNYAKAVTLRLPIVRPT